MNGRIRIKLNPDSHRSEKQVPDPQYWFVPLSCLRVWKFWLLGHWSEVGNRINLVIHDGTFEFLKNVLKSTVLFGKSLFIGKITCVYRYGARYPGGLHGKPIPK